MGNFTVNTALALDGSGTLENPWRIKSLEDFNDFAADANYWAGFTRLETDVNLAGLVYDRAVIAPDVDKTHYNFDGIAFTGVFDGNDHKIIELTIDDGGPSNNYVGLFGSIDEGEVRNLGLEGGSVSVIGAYVGGLVGVNYGTVSNCYSTGHISGDRGVGGLVGDNFGTVSNCYSTGDVNETGTFVGGLVGYNRDIVSSCYSSGDVSGDIQVSGLVGFNSGCVSNCYSTGSVSGNDVVGGLVGFNYDLYGSVSNCYSTGDVNGVDDVGGLVGNNKGSVYNCFWDIDTQTHGVTESFGQTSGTVMNVLGLNTAQMQTESTFTSVGWDFIDEHSNGTTETWQMPAGGGYPVLSFFHIDIPLPLAGSGTVSEPYLVCDSNELGMVSWYPEGCHFKLTRDIDLSGIQWSTAVVPVFTGYFYGNGYRVLNMHISGGGYLGLFGNIRARSQVKNLGLEGGSVRGVHYVGGLVVENWGSVSNCFSIGSFIGEVYVGGLVGENWGSISNCYSVVDVSGHTHVGGLVGNNFYGSVSHRYSAGFVNSNSKVGGLIGRNYGGVSNCYFTGDVNGTSYLVGGLVGYNQNGYVSNCYSKGAVIGRGTVGGLVVANNESVSISKCYATADVNGFQGSAGGLVAGNSGSVTNCYSTGTVSGEGYVGGLVASNGDSGSVSNCYSTGSVIGDDWVGGLVGFNGGSVSNCHSTGDVNGVDDVGGLVGRNYSKGAITNCYSTGRVSGTSDVGGLSGLNYFGATITACFWDIETSDCNSSSGGIGKTTGEMQTRSTFTNAGWDFVGETANGTEDSWTIHETVDYPKFVWELVNFIGWYEVDFLDFAFFANRWMDSNCGVANDCDGADLNFSDKVDGADMKIFFDQWMEGIE
jgi:hypothetical protein